MATDGQGKYAAALDAGERKRLREQGRQWLDAQHKWLAGLLDGTAPPLWNKALDLEHWQQDPDLASVSGDAIARLPEGEQEAWRQLWKGIADTLPKAREKTGKEQVPAKKP